MCSWQRWWHTYTEIKGKTHFGKEMTSRSLFRHVNKYKFIHEWIMSDSERVLQTFHLLQPSPRTQKKRQAENRRQRPDIETRWVVAMLGYCIQRGSWRPLKVGAALWLRPGILRGFYPAKFRQSPARRVGEEEDPEDDCTDGDERTENEGGRGNVRAWEKEGNNLIITKWQEHDVERWSGGRSLMVTCSESEPATANKLDIISL